MIGQFEFSQDFFFFCYSVVPNKSSKTRDRDVLKIVINVALRGENGEKSRSEKLECANEDVSE